jgi:chromosome segregation protein
MRMRNSGTRDELYLALRLAAIAGGAERMPFIADEMLVNFDDRRARAALRVLAALGVERQTLLFTHHAHIAAMAMDLAMQIKGIAPVHHLPPEGALIPA